MSWYNNQKEEWKEIIETVAAEIKRSNVIVEKDLIQSLFLYELSKTNFHLYLKVAHHYQKYMVLLIDFQKIQIYR